MKIKFFIDKYTGKRLAILLKNAGLESDIDVFTKDHIIIIKSRSMTDRVRGIVKKTSLTAEKLDELYNTSKSV